ncbi:MAG: S1 RNA-binding domain-containing protein, partial [Mycoplasmatales bacterium]
MVKEIFPQDKYKVELTRIPLLKEELKNNLDKVAIGSVITIKDFVKNRAGIEFDYEGFKVFIPYLLLSHSFIDAESDISYIIGKEAKIIECEETKFGYDVVANARELEGNPFEDYVKTIAENDEVEGKIIRIEHYGMFLELTPGVKALLHKNDYSLDFIKEIDNLDLGSEVKAKIKRIDEEKKQVDLTI